MGPISRINNVRRWRQKREERKEKKVREKRKEERNGPGSSTAKREKECNQIKSNRIKMQTGRERERKKRSGRGSESMAKSQRVLVKVTKTTKLAGEGGSGWAMAGRNAHPFRLQSCVSPRPHFSLVSSGGEDALWKLHP
ncbi:hypothetical protein M747DRAFT_163164 [Aspergillus niger ATCC 13496]|uniref:Uncharacterized protein n=1 Tax=Aspergillus niger ATCC 13496 TaxID=1353008 RepID=A0A370CA64_ASPNG|nr:hypothetical protein M747DRAFT_163164 [Aspergillus niger ATCC 13496]